MIVEEADVDERQQQHQQKENNYPWDIYNDKTPREIIEMIGLATSLNPSMHQDTKQDFMNNLTLLANFNREIAIKSMLFAHRYLLETLEKNYKNADYTVPQIFFAPEYFRTCQQLVYGKKITNANEKISRDDMASSFEAYKNKFPVGSTVGVDTGSIFYANVQSSLARQSATIFSSHVVESFQNRMKSYFFFSLSQDLDLEKSDLYKLVDYIYGKCTTEDDIKWPAKIEKTQALEDKVTELTNEYDIGKANKPATDTKISQFPGVYIVPLYKILKALEKFNVSQSIASTNAQIEVSFPWVHNYMRLLMEDEVKSYGKRKKTRVARKIKNCINSAKEIVFKKAPYMSKEFYDLILALIEETRHQIRNSKRYLSTSSPNVDIKYCFVPEAFSIYHSKKVFSMMPRYAFQRQYVEIDMKTLQTVVNRSKKTKDIAVFDQSQKDSYDRDAKYYMSLFDLTTVAKFGSVEEMKKQNPIVMFRNLVRTNGVAIDFVFSKAAKTRISQADEEIELTMADFEDWELQHVFRLWGVDPGITDIFVASDGETKEHHEIRTMSTAEYYVKAGFKLNQLKLVQLKKEEDIQKIESDIPTYEVSTVEALDIHLKYLFRYLNVLLTFYDERVSNLRFSNYRGRQRMDAELVNIFIPGRKKYNRTTNKRRKRKEYKKRRKKKEEKEKEKIEGGSNADDSSPVEKADKWKKAEFKNDKRVPIVALGDGKFATTMKGKLSGLSRRLDEKLKVAHEGGRLVLMSINEYYTSQICSNCHKREL